MQAFTGVAVQGESFNRAGANYPFHTGLRRAKFSVLTFGPVQVGRSYGLLHI